ncbi:MAG: hypothetical protein COY66_06795, partial [Candidatus Kerfeldbacteria bacterium CG_4_10_14_0_8_um_filter_42_10]
MLKRLLVLTILLVVHADVMALDLKLPWTAGETWQVTVQYGGYYGSGYDAYHTDANNGYYAIDFDKPGVPQGSGLPILAAESGTISFAGGDSSAGFGYYVKINHGSGYETLYGHLKEWPMVSQGQAVFQGQQVGKLGSTGWSTSDHLHFCLYYNGQCLSSQPNSKPEPISGYTNVMYGQNLTSNNTGAIYSCSWHAQNPNTVVPLYPGQTGSFTVSYTNTGNTDWKNSGGVSNPDYIELRSCNSNGNVVDSWLYHSSWINAQRVVAPNASNVAPDQNAWFVFTGKVPSSATPGTSQNVYFRPYHATGGLINSWGGMHFTVYVVPYYNIHPNLQALNMNSALWQTYYVNMPFADQVTVFVTGEAHTTVSGDDSDLRLKINGAFVSNWNQEKALDGDDL